jgi:hypothetical protein
VPKLKVTLKVNLHGVAAVTEVQAIEEIVEPVAPAPEKPAAEAMDTDAAAANGDQPAAEGDAAAAEPQVRNKSSDPQPSHCNASTIPGENEDELRLETVNADAGKDAQLNR